MRHRLRDLCEQRILKPGRPFEAIEIDGAPVGFVVRELWVADGDFVPLGLSLHVPVIHRHGVAVPTETAQHLGVEIGIVEDVPEVKNAALGAVGPRCHSALPKSGFNRRKMRQPIANDARLEAPVTSHAIG